MKVPELSDASLDGLRSFDQLSLVNAIDSLRSSGIDHYVSLPQIIVCGDQSSGKSSVLEAISGVPFPIKSTICTRFPIELVLRNAPVEALEVRIVPHQSRSESDQQSLLSFNKTLESFSDLPELINSAKSAMTVLTPGMSFSRDILRIEIHGPDRPHLTIVDLPGLIHSETKDQSVDDVTLIQEVVQGYMKQERTIILAVVSAKNDHANQIVLRLCRTIDPRGRRTLGIVTKPDTLLQGSPTEQKFISLVKNDDIKFSLGWHVLRNLDSEEGSYSLEHRNTREEYFFSRGSWAGIPTSSLGIKNLRSRLSKLLVQQIAIELPALITEIETKSTWCISQLNQMGKPRESMEEKRAYLVQLSQSFQRLVTAATEGTYNDKFFADATTGFDKRLRAVIQKLSIAFSAEMRKNGREYVLSSQAGCKSRVVTHEQLCEEVMDLVEKTRGRELPGLLNPMIISDLFRKLSSPWEDIASSYVEKVWKATQAFLNHALKAVTDNGTAEAIMNVALRPKLAQIRENLHVKLDELLQPHREGHPITYRDNFENDLLQDGFNEEAISSAIEEKLRRFLRAGPSSPSVSISGHFNLQALHTELLELHRPYFENARYNAKCAIGYVDKYYEAALGRLIDDIAVQVIESNLVSALEQILDPLTIVKMTDSEINQIAGETEETRETRQLLQNQLDTLNKGTDIFQRHQRSGIFTLAQELQQQIDKQSFWHSDSPKADIEAGEDPKFAEEVQSISDEFSANDEAITPQNDGIHAKVEGLDAEEGAELALLEKRKLKKKGKHALKKDRDRYDFFKARETLA
ncbi:unnamed protein product [Clonostachys chloroleuca]|uniref:Interferon-induced GTP-binding protein Mx n=1 Tax=Clonostachys chloroleuca TaxID=1926264 RepID=A0AA35LU71_9HYPO|nr:unnamed protein product [Clonostachys chloroleuca]